MRADCRAIRQRSGLSPADRVVREGLSRAGLSRPRRQGRGRRDLGAPPAPERRPARAARTPPRPTPPAGGARRTPTCVPMPCRAIGRRRSPRRAAAPSPSPKPGRAPRVPRRTGPVPAPCSNQMPSRARRAAVPAAARSDRAAARRVDAGPRTRAPSRTPGRLPSRSCSPTRGPPGNPAAQTCRLRPRLVRRALGSHPPGDAPEAGPACRARRVGLRALRLRRLPASDRTVHTSCEAGTGYSPGASADAMRNGRRNPQRR